jgi:hypothetical protein
MMRRGHEIPDLRYYNLMEDERMMSIPFLGSAHANFSIGC